MKHVIISSSLPRLCRDKLCELGFEPIVMPPYKRLQRGVAAHPDMLLFLLGDVCLTTKEYFEVARESFDKIEALGYTLRLSDEIPSAEYPNDVLFNSVLIGNNLYGYEKGMSKALIELARERGINTLNVRQGYTKCSTLKVSENAVITADSGIAEAMSACGIDVLSVSAGSIRIDGYDTGFIGGCAGQTKDAVYFCGDVFSHPDGKAINEFCKKHKKECVSLENNTLFDAGSLFFL